jgi:hypothetical protein
MAGDLGVMCGNAIGVRSDDRGDLQREGLRVGLCPERCATARVLDRQCERQPAVGKRDGVEPVAQFRGLGGDDGGSVGEDLEGVPRCCGLTLGRAQVWLEAVPVPAVGVAVGAQGGEDRVDASAFEEQLEASPIEDARVAGQEAARGDEVFAHAGS